MVRRIKKDNKNTYKVREKEETMKMKKKRKRERNRKNRGREAFDGKGGRVVKP